MADRETQVTFEDEDGLVTETDSKDERGGAKGRDGETKADSSEPTSTSTSTSTDPGYDWAFPPTTIEGTVAPAETAVPTDDSTLPENPTVAEVFSAAHQAALRGEEMQEGSPLDLAMKAAMEEIATGSNLSEDPTPQEVFGAMRNAQLLGLEVPPDSPLQKAMDDVMEDIQTGDYLGDDPSPQEVFGAMRNAELLGLEVPPESKLQKAMDKVMEDIQTGDHLGPDPSAEAVLGAMRQAELLGLEVPPGSPLQLAMDKVMDQIQTGSTLGSNPSPTDVLAAARQAELLGLTPPPESPLAMAMENLTGGTGGTGGIGTSSSLPTGSPTAGGMSSSGGTTSPGSTNNDTTDVPADRSDPTGTDPTPGGSGSTGTAPTGGGTTPAAGGEYSWTSAMGTTGVVHADGSVTITDATGAVVPPGGAAHQPPEAEDPPPEDPEDKDEEDPPPEEDEDDDEGMVDPDAATSTGLVAGIVVDPVGIDDVLFGSSTAPGGGATDGPRDDLDTGNGSITGEVVGPRHGAGPDVDPDFQTGDLGRLADPFHSGTGAGNIDGVRPDLLGAIGGGGPLVMDPNTGVNPYAAGDGDGDGDLQLDSAFSGVEEEDPDAAPPFGGPLDDGFDAP